MSKGFIWALIFIALGFGGVFVYKSVFLDKGVIEDQDNIPELIDKFYLSSDEKEAWITFAGDEIFLSLIDAEYENVTLKRVGPDNEIVFENSDLKLRVEQKDSDIFVYKNEEIIFSGKERELVLYDRLINNTWVWNKTYEGVGLDADINNPITPKDIKAFTIKFNEDGNFSGTTDCNSFGGSYTLDNGDIYFGPMFATEEFCPNSQETEFMSMIKDGTYTIGGQNFYIEHDQTVVFNTKS